MTKPTQQPKNKTGMARIEALTVKNYRALHELTLNNITPLTVLLGPNGSGKSTIFDVFAFLSECFSDGLRKAVDRRNRFQELRTRGSEGPIVFELKYRENPGSPRITYHLAIDQNAQGPFIAEEWLHWRRSEHGKPFKFLDFKNGAGDVISGEYPDENEQRIHEELDSPATLAVNTLGQLARHPRVSALRRFITSWYLSYLSAENTRVTPEAGPQERLSISGNNLPNVIQYLEEQYPERLQDILKTLSKRIPQLEKVEANMMADGRLLLTIKDQPFEKPILAKYASDGTLKMLSYLTILYDPSPPQLIGIEEPENQLHPKLLLELAEECRAATARTQLLVTTHSPFFVNGLRPKEVWVLYRDERGYTKVRQVAEMPNIKEMLDAGALLGDLWVENYFDVGNPLVKSGGPQTPEAELAATQSRFDLDS
ncbi:MAG: AAA family ATPase [Chloroflexi bacterium]|nr:AAA family ATPase [Chloroflexota bacterium]OJV96549.1 MAG: ATPase [Chloroflexi bacterium 54-19]